MRKGQVLNMNMNNGNCNSGSLSHLMEQLRKVEFALTEVSLYLDVYPDCKEALEYYHKLVEKHEKLVEEYQAYAPLTYMGNRSQNSWDWINSPWPWHYDSN